MLALKPFLSKDGPWPFVADLLGHSQKALSQAQAALSPLQNSKALVVVGIGGSALGARCLCRALGVKNVFFLENADAARTREVIRQLPLRHLAIHAVSKSGGTTETLLNLHTLISALENAGVKDWGRRLVVTGDPPTGAANPFVALAERVGGQVLPMNPAVGGRFSVLTTVGLLPLLWAGKDGAALLKGAKKALSDAAAGKWDTLLASLWGHAQAGKKTLVFMPYHDPLEDMGEWVVQLVSESLGKHKGNRRVGLTPVRALGSRDQHSYLQLIQDGPRDKQVMVLTVEKPLAEDPAVSALRDWPEFPPLLTGHSLHGVQTAQARATAQALAQDGVPVSLWSLNRLSEESMGYFFGVWMVLVPALAEKMKINAFDQPGVEKSKKETARLLKRR